MRKSLLIFAVLLIAWILTGCRTFNFYTQAARGQLSLLSARKPISKLMQSPKTPDDLKQRFTVLTQIRDFAETNLGLPVNGHYSSYADLKRPYVLWNIEASPEFSMTPKKWWYPVVGKQKYRGYFSHSAATNYAAMLDQAGYDTYIGGVQAYSTLGWFKDTALNTFIYDRDPYLAELVFHELAHQQVFAGGDTDFNEAFATTVGEEGARRWLKTHRPSELEAYELTLRRHREFVALVAKARGELELAYGDERDGKGELKQNEREDRDPAKLEADKNRIFEELLRDYERLKQSWGGDTTYDRWFSRNLNNAKLNSVGAYYDLVPAFEALLDLEKGNLEEFYAASERLAKMPKKQRREWLETVTQSKPTAVHQVGKM